MTWQRSGARASGWPRRPPARGPEGKVSISRSPPRVHIHHDRVEPPGVQDGSSGAT
jgi:hypothetical protein